jgi:ferredoxin-NADP reductase
MMTSLNLLLWIAFGIVLQVALFLVISFWQHWQSYSRLKQVEALSSDLHRESDGPKIMQPSWAGFRTFKVARRVVEDVAEQICSFYLEPEDGQPLSTFKPGQFLTFRLDMPESQGGVTKQITRCYSLSDAPDSSYYRISVKRVPPALGSDFPAGVSSNLFHDGVHVGAKLQVRAPSGHFYLEQNNSPIVLIAGGIGITPMMSMMNWCLEQQSKREIWFFYGIRNSSEIAFSAELNAAAKDHPNIHLRLCFSNPLPTDELGKDFHHHGRVDVNLFRAELPLKPFHYYLCGPTPMMESLVPALEDWGVADSHIHFEAFGPASIKRRKSDDVLTDNELPTLQSNVTVTFAKSGKQISWSPQANNLLELAEMQGIAIDSGCRAGGCGTCQTSIQCGEVVYQRVPDYDPEPGTCLMCVCVPKTNVTLEA